MKTVINKETGKVLYTTAIDVELLDNEIEVAELLQEPFINPYFDLKNRTFYEGASNDEIVENQKQDVPSEIALWRIRTVLKVRQLENIIQVALDNLEEPTKTAALYIWQFGTSIERKSQTILLLQSILGLESKQVDEIFIQAQNIDL